MEEKGTLVERESRAAPEGQRMEPTPSAKVAEGATVAMVATVAMARVEPGGPRLHWFTTEHPSLSSPPLP